MAPLKSTVMMGYQFVSVRKSTFFKLELKYKTFLRKHWSNVRLSFEEMAEIGFYLSQTALRGNEVTCFWCGEKDLFGQDPKQNYLRSMDIQKCPLRTIYYLLSRYRDDDEKATFWERLIQENKELVSVIEPQSELSIQLRLSTFTDIWKYGSDETLKLSPQSMASAGFFFAPLEPGDDRVICMYCGCPISNWNPCDDPFEEHKINSRIYRTMNSQPKCYFFTALDYSKVRRKVVENYMPPYPLSLNLTDVQEDLDFQKDITTLRTTLTRNSTILDYEAVSREPVSGIMPTLMNFPQIFDSIFIQGSPPNKLGNFKNAIDHSNYRGKLREGGESPKLINSGEKTNEIFDFNAKKNVQRNCPVLSTLVMRENPKKAQVIYKEKSAIPIKDDFKIEPFFTPETCNCFLKATSGPIKPIEHQNHIVETGNYPIQARESRHTRNCLKITELTSPGIIDLKLETSYHNPKAVISSQMNHSETSFEPIIAHQEEYNCGDTARRTFQKISESETANEDLKADPNPSFFKNTLKNIHFGRKEIRFSLKNRELPKNEAIKLNLYLTESWISNPKQEPQNSNSSSGSDNSQVKFLNEKGVLEARKNLTSVEIPKDLCLRYETLCNQPLIDTKSRAFPKLITPSNAQWHTKCQETSSLNTGERKCQNSISQACLDYSGISNTKLLSNISGDDIPIYTQRFSSKVCKRKLIIPSSIPAIKRKKIGDQTNIKHGVSKGEMLDSILFSDGQICKSWAVENQSFVLCQESDANFTSHTRNDTTKNPLLILRHTSPELLKTADFQNCVDLRSLKKHPHEHRDKITEKKNTKICEIGLLQKILDSKTHTPPSSLYQNGRSGENHEQPLLQGLKLNEKRDGTHFISENLNVSAQESTPANKEPGTCNPKVLPFSLAECFLDINKCKQEVEDTHLEEDDILNPADDTLAPFIWGRADESEKMTIGEWFKRSLENFETRTLSESEQAIQKFEAIFDKLIDCIENSV